jgi:hypothetical protein
MITIEQISIIEERIAKKAEEISYQVTEQYGDRRIQATMYELIKSYIIHGARLFQEELLNLKDNETETSID